MSFELFEEDTHATLSSEISNEDICESKDLLISVCYNEIDLGKTDYGFNQGFEGNEANMYFERMNTFSNLTINEILDTPDSHDLHFTRNDLNNKSNYFLKNILKKMNPEIGKSNPEIFHFALDPNCETFASRKTGERNPRIYFMVGYNGMIHPILFDPYHEINGKR